MNNKAFRKAFIDTLPVMSGYLVLGIGYGIVMAEKGFGIIWTFLSSFFIYAGSLEYALINLMSQHASLLSVFFTSLAVNARHIFYGISMLKKYLKIRLKPLVIFTLTDETYSLVCESNEEEDYYIYVSILDYFYWLTGSVIGGLAGSLIPFSMEGVEFSLTALFVTIFVDQWLNNKDHQGALIGLVSSVVCLLVLGPASFLIPSMAVILSALFVMSRQKGGRDE